MARIDDGHSTIISFSLDPTVKLYQKTVTPPGISAGGPNDTTTMLNDRWRTRKPKKLLTLLQAGFVAAYDPAVYNEIVSMAGINQLLTITFPDGSSVAFYGWLDEFKPNESQGGSQPTANVSIEPSNEDNANPPVETPPVYSTP